MRAAFAVVVVALMLSVVGIDAKRPKAFELDGYDFERYVKDFGKKYTLEERNRRQKLFETELASVRKHNAEGHTWKQGVNKFSDWTQEEKRARLYGNIVAMKGQTMSKPEKVYKAMATPANLPKSVDWRTVQPPVVTPVKDQGQCGSCWAHAAVEAIESAVARTTGNLHVLSQQQITSCTPNPKQCGGTGGCGGAIYELGIDYVVQNGGIAQEWSQPYLSYWGKSPACPAKINATVAQVTGYTSVTHNDGVAMHEALALQGPLAVSVDASAWASYESGVFAGCSYAKNISMDHAVQAVGYGVDSDSGLNYWIIRNSWSAGWGESGFIRLLRAANGASEACGWNVNPQNGVGCKGETAPQWACGMCGVAFDTLYANAKP